MKIFNLRNIFSLVLIFAFSFDVNAQNSTIEEVIVSAEKRDESLQDISQAVSALTDSDLENKNLKEFHIKISKIQNHEKSLSLARKKIHPFLKSRYTLKTVKKLSDYLWRIRVKIAIVNNSTVPYEFAQTCNTSNMYTSTTRGVKIYTETCGNSKIEISRISPKGVFRDEIDILIRSKDRPTGQEVSLYFGGAPSLHLGTIIIPPPKSS